MGTPIEGSFGGVEFATPATFTATHGVPVETSTSLTESVPIDEGTHTGEVSEVIASPAKTPSVQRGATPPAATQIETTPVTPLVISTSDPFAALSQAVNDSSSLVVTHSSIPISATRGPDADLFSEEFEDILEDPDDEPVLRRRISKFEEKEFMGMCFLSPPPLFFLAKFTFPLLFVCPFLSFAEPFEGPGLTANVGVSVAATPAAPTTPIPAVSSASVSAVFTAFVFAVPSMLVSVLPTTPIITGLGELSFPLFLSSFLPRGFAFPLFFFLGFSSHALCFLDRFSSYGAFSV